MKAETSKTQRQMNENHTKRSKYKATEIIFKQINRKGNKIKNQQISKFTTKRNNIKTETLSHKQMNVHVHQVQVHARQKKNYNFRDLIIVQSPHRV